MNKYRIVELLCVVFAVIFIVNSVSGEKTTSMTASEITESILSDEFSSYIERDREYVREKYGFDPEIFTSFSCYSSDDIMNVNEFFVGVAEDKVDASVSETIEAYRSEKHTLFDDYAPEEAALLDAARLEIKGNVIIFCVSENADEIYSAFTSLF